MKKLLLVCCLATGMAGMLPNPNVYAVETATTAGSLILPAGFLSINGDTVTAIDLGSNGSAVLRGRSTQTPVQIVMDAPGRQGGHMTQTEDYMIAGMDTGNALFFDAATGTLYIVNLSADDVVVLKETAVSAQ